MELGWCGGKRCVKSGVTSSKTVDQVCYCQKGSYGTCHDREAGRRTPDGFVDALWRQAGQCTIHLSRNVIQRYSALKRA